jgi:hypothetical protein
MVQGPDLSLEPLRDTHIVSIHPRDVLACHLIQAEAQLGPQADPAALNHCGPNSRIAANHVHGSIRRSGVDNQDLEILKRLSREASEGLGQESLGIQRRH